MTFCALVVCLPFGLGSAIYLSEYARAAHAPGHQAVPRGPRRHPDRRLRLLRADGHQPHRARPLADRRHARGLQRAVSRSRHGRHDHADGRVALRGRDVGRPARSARRRVRAREHQARSRDHASCSRPRSRHRRLVRARRLACDRRDDDRAHRGRRHSRIWPSIPAKRCRRSLRSSRRPARATSRPGASGTRRSSPSGSLLFVATFAMNIVSIRIVRRYREIYE